MKIHKRRLMRIAATVLLALPFALATAPAFSIHTCVPGADDYDQCVVNTANDEPSDLGSAEEGNSLWLDFSHDQDDDNCC